jgi:hypothetical protein
VSILAGQRLEGGQLRDTKGDGKNGPAPRDVLAKIRGVESVRELSSKDGELRLELVTTTEDDLRAEIFRAAVEGGLVLIGLSAKAQNLEQVFRDLTTGAAAAAAAADEDEDDDEDDDDDEDSDDEGTSEEDSEDDEDSDDDEPADDDSDEDDDSDDDDSDDDDSDDDSDDSDEKKKEA